MKIYALVGRSGTGKSFKAQNVAGMYNIEYIIDDGLLIMGNKIIAGVSAKREDTRIAAVKRAIFFNEDHRQEVISIIKNHEIDKLLIIGTSENMIQNIMRSLHLGKEYELVRIEEVSTKEEIEAATRARKLKGKHVIPVPTFEVKKQFSGYFVDSIRNLVFKNDKEYVAYEKTVVRPTFSYLGKYDISPKALRKIVEVAARENSYLNRVYNVDIENREMGTIITLGVSVKLSGSLYIIGENIVKHVKEIVEYMTNINIIEVNAIIREITIEEDTMYYPTENYLK